MKKWIHILLLSATVIGSVLLLEGCVGGYVAVGPDYYGPAYGGAVFYGHPYYGHGFWGGPRGRRWR